MECTYIGDELDDRMSFNVFFGWLNDDLKEDFIFKSNLKKEVILPGKIFIIILFLTTLDQSQVMLLSFTLYEQIGYMYICCFKAWCLSAFSLNIAMSMITGLARNLFSGLTLWAPWVYRTTNELGCYGFLVNFSCRICIIGVYLLFCYN